MPKKQNNNQKRPITFKRVALYMFFGLVTLGFVGSLTALGIVYHYVKDLERVRLGDVEVRETSFIYDANGELLIQLHDVENRNTVPIESMPEHLIKGVVAMEDHRFFDHYGFSPRDFIRGVYLTYTGQSRQGASTITQQVARNRILQDQVFTVERKIKEIYLAFIIEQEYSKDEILETYMNEIFMGGSAHGMQAASQQYFSKDVGEINLAEAALLVGLIPSPNAYSPFSSMERAKNRQALVLSQMLQQGIISQEDRQEALDYEIVLSRGDTSEEEVVDENTPLYTYFTDYAIRQAQDIVSELTGMSRADASLYLHRAGLTIHTTLDLNLQRAAETAMHDILTRRDGIDERIMRAALNDPDPDIRALAREVQTAGGTFIWEHPARAAQLQPQVAMMIMEPDTGYIRVWIGGRDIFGRHGLDRVASIQNQPGSAMKPLMVYGPALATGNYTAASVIDDAPVSFPTIPGQDPYEPRNYAPNTFYGLTSIRGAITPSHNVSAVKLLSEIGVMNAINWAKSLGIESLVTTGTANDVGLAAALGGLTDGVTLYEMTRAYNVFNNKGVLVEPSVITRIVRKDGTILYDAPPPKQEIVIEQDLAWLMTNLMQDVINHGTGYQGMRSIGGYTGQAAGKTGTTNNNLDAMFVGYTPDYTAGVWIGHDDHLTGLVQTNFKGERLLIPGSTGGDIAANWMRGGLPTNVGSGFATSIFGRTMANITGNQNLPTFEPASSNIIQMTVCAQSGLRPGPLCTSIRTEQFIRGTEPQSHQVCTIHRSVHICLESGGLANEFCPLHLVTTQVRFVREPYPEIRDPAGNVLDPQDVHLQVPFSTCDIHQYVEPIPWPEPGEPGDPVDPGEPGGEP
ncbi:MAG TPA: transglycosylase domain-containing protein, partial [Bacillota bacterium]|nr:transglycosylase domain-containing protein [Bacillota bacterium]